MSFEPVAGSSIFLDVPRTHSAYHHIHHLARYSALTGFADGTFRPSDETTVVYFLGMIIRLAGIYLPGGTWSVRAENYYQFARGNNILPEGVGRNDPLTREVAFIITYRFLSQGHITAWNRVQDGERDTSVNLLMFPDVVRGEGMLVYGAEINALIVLLQHGIISGGSNNRLRPQENITRAEAAKMLSRAVTPSTDIPLMDRINPYIPSFELRTTTIEGRLFVPTVGRTYRRTTNEYGNFTFRFIAPTTGFYSFTITNNCAALVYSVYLGATPEFTPLFFTPERPPGQPTSTQVRHVLSNGQDVVVSVAGAATQDFEITVEEVFITWPIPARHFVARSVFGIRSGSLHEGTDISAPLGTPVHAMMAGEVIESAFYARAGETLGIEHGNNYRTRYLHLARGSYMVFLGDNVIAGELIAFSGNTGNTDGVGHLHFEIRRPPDHAPINPLDRYYWSDHTQGRRNGNNNPFFILLDSYGNRIRVEADTPFAAGRPILGRPIDEHGNFIRVYDARHVVNEEFCSPQFWSIFPQHTCICLR
ncbi:MAG: peptidoglycan DD-metalloendopeptidase family protein [Defluviitaleaceae bacterium]|nr:peptidoglycan DD-metalloendopeptidase family protein [Defluviitaleaceae bacterium]